MDFDGMTELLNAFELDFNDRLDRIIDAKHYDNFDEEESRLALVKLSKTLHIVAMQLNEIAEQQG
jgi:hypothetical protein